MTGKETPLEERLRIAREAAAHGLYSPEHEHDSCGMGFVADIKGRQSHGVVELAIQALVNLTHRGACGCDPDTGDGGGILIQLPDRFLRRVCGEAGLTLPPRGRYAVGMMFLPRDPVRRRQCVEIVERIAGEEGQRVLGWRDVPVEPSAVGPLARESLPRIQQVFVAAGAEVPDQDAFERKLYVLRRRISNTCLRVGLGSDDGLYVCSLSSRTLVYKGLLIADQLPRFYRDVTERDFETAISLVHSRFSTNTFPSWSRAHPYRFICHNGEINTLRGNVNWMHARQRQFRSPAFGSDIEKLLPIVDESGSDSEMFDNTLELISHTGRSLPHAVMMMIPEAWQKHATMSETKRAFYEYHACLLEPWDGPASIAFTDGTVVGAVLDRNGLRPSRYVVTSDGLVVMASEVGVFDVRPEDVVQKARLEPGRMFLVDTAQGRIVDDVEIKEGMAARRPYRAWLDQNLVSLEDLSEPERMSLPPTHESDRLLVRQRVHGYTREDIRLLVRPMAVNAEESIGSMGTDTPLAVLSDRPQLLFNYFKQQFAQVTNPPIDSLREDLVMSLRQSIGGEGNFFEETPEHCRQLVLDEPVLTNSELAKIKALDQPGLRAKVLPTLFEVAGGGAELERALQALCEQAEAAVDAGTTLVVLSDRGHDRTHAPIPSLLAVSGVHHHLIRAGKRTQCGLIVESGESREVMHHCLLLGYGASAINPYLVYELIHHEVEQNLLHGVEPEHAIESYLKACDKGIRKVMSKMGISTLQSYQGAQIFEAVGLGQEVIDRYFTWTASRIGGVGLDEIATECAVRHHVAWDVPVVLNPDLDPGGNYQWRRRGEYHMYNPETIALLQHAVRSGKYELFKKFSAKANDYSKRLCTIRGLIELRRGTPIPIDEVEPVTEIVKRFKTGAMSFGSISKEAHENLAIAMNRIGARSNTGEGGEDPARYVPDANGDSRRSAIKQVASGRFGVTSEYLVNADELQIKMAQGAKPGEGGQLPGHKVDQVIARVRYSTPGVGLISPPPHHDIYSIEDLAQLIHDLKNANSRARISVKLVSEVGVGTVAAGVAKAKADTVLISGDSGGTGASPLTSIKHAGTPWEIGLAETQQTLVANGLRSRIRVETDGQLKTGRDVAVAALLGAEEFGFGTAALVSSGCIMMRVCHLNTCPVGVATQDPELRKRFRGEPEHVINFMFFVAQELREVMAELGFRTVADMVGRADMLEAKPAIEHWKAKGIDLSRVLHMPTVTAGTPLCNTESQDHGLDKALDHLLIERARPALEHRKKVHIGVALRNVQRTVCTMLSSEITRRWGRDGLPPGTIEIVGRGSAGQSFGAFMASGIDVRIEGDANDYLGKGMSGGRIVVVPPAGSRFTPEENVIAGNVVLYGATGGELFLRGRAGERFCVRNSGATAVVEGVGDHGCEYMTKGVVVVLGGTGRNFAAGMSGGVAYVLDEAGDFEVRCNRSMVDLDQLSSADEAALRGLVEAHAEHTGSAVAARVLADWTGMRKKFVKVMAREYKKVVAAQHYDSEMAQLATGM